MTVQAKNSTTPQFGSYTFNRNYAANNYTYPNREYAFEAAETLGRVKFVSQQKPEELLVNTAEPGHVAFVS